MNQLEKKRLDTTLAIANYAASSSTVVTAPTPGLELPKQVILTASDTLLYATIWKIYFEEELAQKDLLEILVEVGVVAVTSAGTTYLISKGSLAILCELTDWLGPPGWALKIVVSGSLIGMVGVVWAMICDRMYQEKTQAITTGH